MRFLIAMLIVACSSPAVLSEGFAITDLGLYRAVNNNGVPGWVKVMPFAPGDTVINWKGSPPDSPPPLPPIPPSGNIAARVEAISRAMIKDGLESTTLLSVVRIFQRPDVDLSQASIGLKAAIGIIAKSPLFPDNKFETWFAQVDGLSSGPYTKEFIGQIESGLSQAFGATSRLFGSMGTDEEIEAISIIGKIGSALSRAEEINIIAIIELIKLIIDLLRDLGILDFSNASVAAHDIPLISLKTRLQSLPLSLFTPVSQPYEGGGYMGPWQSRTPAAMRADLVRLSR